MLLSNKDIGLLGVSLLNSAQGGGYNNPGLGLLSALQYVINQQPQAEQYNPFPRATDQTQQSEQFGQEAIPMTIKKLPSTGDFSIESLQAAAQQAWPNNPLMQQVALTQAIHESGLARGKPSGLALKYNLFGIKEDGNAGAVNMPTKEFLGGQPTQINDNFGVNNSVLDSFLQHKNFLRYKRYKPVLAATTPQQAFEALKAAGYATDPKYASSLNNIYNTYVAPLYQS